MIPLLVVLSLHEVTVLKQASPESVDCAALIQKLGNEDFIVREQAESALAKLGLRAIPALAKAGANSDAEIRDRAKRLLGVYNQTNLCVQEPRPDVLLAIEYLDRVRGLGLPFLCRDEDLSYLARCKNLTSISIVRGTISGAGLAHLAGLTQLKRLGIESTGLDGSGFESIAALQRLEELEIIGPVTDKTLAAIARMPALRHLDLTDTKITDAGLRELANTQSLQLIFITNADQITGDGLLQLARAPRLTSFGLSRCPNVAGKDQISLLMKLKENRDKK